MMLTFCANASCALKQEDLKWASLGCSSIGESERKGGSRETPGDLSGSEQKGNSEVRWDRRLSRSPMLERPKLAHFKCSCLSAQEALAQNVNIII